MKKLFYPFALIMIIGTNVYANNVQISGLVTSASNVQFTISWDNSWFTPGVNYDAVWIFVKSQDCAGTSAWDHVNLSTTAANHSATGGLFVEVSTDGRGVFIRRNSAGGGTQSGNISLGFASTIAAFATMNFQVFGIEMVWVPQGDFRAGDGSTNHTTQSASSFGTGNTAPPRLVNSEASVVQDFFRNDKAGDGGFGITGHNTVPAAFPKGWTGFYCMKYEISQQQYAAFLNALTLAQQGTRTANPPNSPAGTLAMTTVGNQNRNAIVIQTPGAAGGVPAVYNTNLNGDGTFGDGDNIACNYLSWEDLLAYLDWSGLRPMTELEFEKAVRGFDAPFTSEFAWGTTTVLQAISNSLTNGGTASEVSTAAGNGLCAQGAGASTTLGPLRTGFAATASTTRINSGGAQWGIMDMSGNVWEQCISIGFLNATIRLGGGLIFTGLNGDGNLNSSGNHNTSNWPDNTALGTTIVRGGNWEYPAPRAQTSDRFYVNSIAENSVRTRRTGRP
jgi:formylglycine-generating enzyme required for sulfatase activity